MDVEEYTRALAAANRYGWAFLAAYGSTWIVSAVAWAKTSPRTAAIVTLFQGMVALPAALALTFLVPGPPRPSHAALESLSVVLATGQLLGLPVVIFLVLSRRYTVVPLGAVVLLVVHRPIRGFTEPRSTWCWAASFRSPPRSSAATPNAKAAPARPSARTEPACRPGLSC